MEERQQKTKQEKNCDMPLQVRLFELQFILFSLLRHSPPPISAKNKGMKMLLNIVQNISECAMLPLFTDNNYHGCCQDA